MQLASIRFLRACACVCVSHREAANDRATGNLLIKTFSRRCKRSTTMKINKSKPPPGVNSSGRHPACTSNVSSAETRSSHFSSAAFAVQEWAERRTAMLYACPLDYNASEQMPEKRAGSSLYSRHPRTGREFLSCYFSFGRFGLSLAFTPRPFICTSCRMLIMEAVEQKWSSIYPE